MINDSFLTCSPLYPATGGQAPQAIQGGGQMPEILEGTGYRILVVDDHKDIRLLIRKMLQKHGYQVDELLDGSDVEKFTMANRPDLILLDVDMPVKDGVQALADIRGNKKVCATPVIMITAHGDLDSRLKCLEVGANDFLQKPVDVSELLARIKTNINAVQAQNLKVVIELATATAHQINQPLTLLIAYLQMMEANMTGEGQTRKKTEECLKAAREIKDIVKKLTGLQNYKSIPYAGASFMTDLDQPTSKNS